MAPDRVTRQFGPASGEISLRFDGINFYPSRIVVQLLLQMAQTQHPYLTELGLNTRYHEMRPVRRKRSPIFLESAEKLRDLKRRFEEQQNQHKQQKSTIITEPEDTDYDSDIELPSFQLARAVNTFLSEKEHAKDTTLQSVEAKKLLLNLQRTDLAPHQKNSVESSYELQSQLQQYVNNTTEMAIQPSCLPAQLRRNSLDKMNVRNLIHSPNSLPNNNNTIPTITIDLTHYPNQPRNTLNAVSNKIASM